jgi:allantoicase
MPVFDFTGFIDLAAEKLGGKALLCSDDFFGEKENLLKPSRGQFVPGKHTDDGRWVDGWESSRRREPGHDWCIIQLAATGKIYGIDIDTNHFTGNYPPFASVDAFNIKDAVTDDFELLEWTEILPKSPLGPDMQNLFSITDNSSYTHLRLNIYPDGGVARFKVYGEVAKNWSAVTPGDEPDLAAAVNGGKAMLCSDMFFSHMDNLIMPGRGIDISDGWETRRSRIPGNEDWVIIALAHPGKINRISIDTAHFKGNYPESCKLEGCYVAPETKIDFLKDAPNWSVILPRISLQADEEHLFEASPGTTGTYSHVRLTIFPDGGISRLRLFGTPVL